jgi:CBS domain-containing protein
MKAHEIMSRQVVSVTPDNTLVDLANLMLEKRFSGVPVITAKGKLVGMITEGDCMHRVETGTEKKQSFWRSLLAGAEGRAENYIREHGRKVSEVMTRNPITVGEETDVSEIIHLMEKHQVKRVPVVKGGTVVGIVSRANIVQAVASVLREGVEGKDSDAKIRDKVLDALAELPWPAKTFVTVTVKDGVVDLWGTFTAFRQDESAIVAAENVPDVKGVHNHLAWVDPLSGLVIYEGDAKKPVGCATD